MLNSLSRINYTLTNLSFILALDQTRLCHIPSTILQILIAWLTALQSYSNLIGDATTTIDVIIEKERNHLEGEFVGFETLQGDPIGSQMMEQEGAPVRAMLTTSWRSGSTFIGDIIKAHPGTFYHYEPLAYNGTVQYRSGRQAQYAIYNLKNLMHCNYKPLGKNLCGKL